MAVHVFLDLAHEVSVRDLRNFLSCVSHDVDADQDLRVMRSQEDTVGYLAVGYYPAEETTERNPDGTGTSAE